MIWKGHRERFVLLGGMVLLLTLAIFVTPTEAQAPKTLSSSSQEAGAKELHRDVTKFGMDPAHFMGQTNKQALKAVPPLQQKESQMPAGNERARTEQQANNRSAEKSFSKRDIDLLARLIYFEGRGEPYSGKVAIGAVVMNRVDSDEFADTLEGVVMTPGAFSPVRNGQLGNRTNAECRKAALEALSGKDPTNGALYFYNPRTATDRWIFSRPHAITIGNHVFAH
ncbi:MAG: cell wall hydrolase [Clostridia bacterium]